MTPNWLPYLTLLLGIACGLVIQAERVRELSKLCQEFRVMVEKAYEVDE